MRNKMIIDLAKTVIKNSVLKSNMKFKFIILLTVLTLFVCSFEVSGAIQKLVYPGDSSIETIEILGLPATTTTPASRREKRTVVPSGYKLCQPGYVLVEGLQKCVPKNFQFSLPPHLVQRPNSRPTRRHFIESTISGVPRALSPPEALRSTMKNVHHVQSTTFPSTRIPEIEVYPSLTVTTEENNSVYVNDEEGTENEVESTQKQAVTVFSEASGSESKEGTVKQADNQQDFEENKEQSTVLAPTTETKTLPTEAPVPEVDLAYLKFRQLRLEATSNHRNCKHHFDVKLFHSGETTDDDDYD